MNDKTGYRFVDTNVLVYAHDTSAGAKHIAAKALVIELWQQMNGCLSVQVLQEFHVVVTRKIKLPLPLLTAYQQIENLSVWRVYGPSALDVLSAIKIQERYQISYWDAMIVWCAVQLKCKEILSEDLNPGQIYEGIPVINPFI